MNYVQHLEIESVVYSGYKIIALTQKQYKSGQFNYFLPTIKTVFSKSANVFARY